MEFYYSTMSYYYYSQMVDEVSQKRRTIHD